ncbi:MAG: addiction module protein [Acidobacteriota bacterium]|nr:MAG: addiction module protein [Acidobacteriota bacterium]
MNTEVVLPLDKMTVAEKMDVVDRIMDDLSRNSADVPVIGWHGDVLAKRAADIAVGRDKFISLADAEQRIREKTGRQ